MQWMIDGAYGDLYRTAMGYRQLKPHNESENCLPSRPSVFRTFARAIRSLAGRLLSGAKQSLQTLSPARTTKSAPQRPILHTK